MLKCLYCNRKCNVTIVGLYCDLKKRKGKNPRIFVFLYMQKDKLLSKYNTGSNFAWKKSRILSN